MRRYMWTATALVLTLAACSSGRSSGYHPVIDPAKFSANVTNAWFPLIAGTTFTYRGTKDGKSSRDDFVVLSRTKTIRGVPCRVVRDRLYLNGKLEERTLDYYTQDQDGNVWYFGEDTAELDSSGKVTSTEGTWRSGRNGAEPGIFMDTHPTVGVGHRQEFYKGHAEDVYKVVSLSAPVTVPYGRFGSALRTQETTALEPGVVDAKYYVRGVGEVEERSMKGPFEENSLVKVSKS